MMGGGGGGGESMAATIVNKRVDLAIDDLRRDSLAH